MANVKISDLAAAASVTAGQQFEVNDASNSKSVLASQVATYTLSTMDSADITAAGGLIVANNLSDVASASTARTNLGLGTIATQANTAVNIDGGNIDGTVIGSGTAAAATVTTLTTTGATTFGAEVVEKVFALSGTTPALNPANGTIQTWTLTGNSSPTDSFAAGESILLMVDDGTAYTITWPTMTWVNNAGSAPTLATSGYTVVALWKVSTTLYGALVGDGS